MRLSIVTLKNGQPNHKVVCGVKKTRNIIAYKEGRKTSYVDVDGLLNKPVQIAGGFEMVYEVGKFSVEQALLEIKKYKACKRIEWWKE